MRKFLTICAILLSLSASAQWQLTGSRVRYVNGIGIPTRDTSAMTPADSSQILIRPADSSLYVRYKRAWMRVGGGGGSIAGSGTTNYIPKFTSSSAIGNSQIFDNGTSVGIGTPSPSTLLELNKNSNAIIEQFRITNNNAGLGNVGSKILFNGFYKQSEITSFGIPGSITGGYLTFSTNSNSDVMTERLRIDNTGNVGIGTTSPGQKLDVNGIARVTTEIRNKNTAGNISYFTFEENGNTNSATFISGDARTTGNMGLWTNSVERIRIDNAGNVGIGTTSPGARLDVAGIFNGTQATFGFTSGRGLLIGTALNGGTNEGTTILNARGAGAGQFQFQTDGTDRVTLTASGNVGIGYTTPAARLAVNGKVLINTNTDNGVDELIVGGGVFADTYESNDGLGVRTGISFVPAQAGITGTISNHNYLLQSNATTRVTITANGRILANTTTDNGTDRLQVNGSIQGTGFNQAYLARTTTYTAATNDYFIDCTTGTFTVNLFTAVGNTGRILIIKNSGTGTITVDPNGSQTIDGATTQTLSTQWSRVHIISDGANWKIISN
jgi:hypothetical protein